MKKLYMLIICLTMFSVYLPKHQENTNLASAQSSQVDHIWQVAWSPVGDRFAVMYIIDVRGNDDDIVAIYDGQTYQEIGVIPNIPRDGGPSISELAWNPDGTRLAITKGSGNPLVEIWDVSTPPFQFVTEYIAGEHGGSTQVSWKSVNEVSINTSFNIHVIDATAGNLIQIIEDTLAWQGKSFNADDMHWSPNGRYLFVGGTPGMLWDTQLNTEYYIDVNDHVDPMAWSPDGSQFVAYYNDVYHIWDVVSLQEMGTLEGSFDYAREVYWENGVIAALVVTTELDIYIQFWDDQSFAMIGTEPVPDYRYTFSLSPDATQILYGTQAGTFQIEFTPLANTLDTLRELVDECVTDNGINNSLHAKINSGQLNAFINEVEAQRGKKITEECADELIDMANRLIEQESEE